MSTFGPAHPCTPPPRRQLSLNSVAAHSSFSADVDLCLAPPLRQSSHRRQARSDSLSSNEDDCAPRRAPLFEYSCSAFLDPSLSTTRLGTAIAGDLREPPPAPLLPSVPVFVSNSQPKMKGRSLGLRSSSMRRGSAMSNMARFTRNSFAEAEGRGEVQNPVRIIIADEHNYFSSDEMDIDPAKQEDLDAGSWWCSESVSKAGARSLVIDKTRASLPSTLADQALSSEEEDDSTSSSFSSIGQRSFSSSSSLDHDWEASSAPMDSPRPTCDELDPDSHAWAALSPPARGYASLTSTREQMDDLKPRFPRFAFQERKRRKIAEEDPTGGNGPSAAANSRASIGLGLGLGFELEF